MSVPLVELLNKLQKGAETENMSVKVFDTRTSAAVDILNTATYPSVRNVDGTIQILITTAS